MVETAVLISIKPKWVNLILSGKKIVEVRKNAPKLEPPFLCYIYESGTGCVVGEFVCKQIDEYFYITTAPDKTQYMRRDGQRFIPIDFDSLRLTETELEKYGRSWELYGWRISAVKEYETPLPLKAFKTECKQNKPCTACTLFYSSYDGTCAAIPVERPPQSWRYVQRRVGGG